jgi:hypothetical protein
MNIKPIHVAASGPKATSTELREGKKSGWELIWLSMIFPAKWKHPGAIRL